MNNRLEKLLSYVIGISLFFGILSIKLWIIGQFGTDLPHWDQWDAEGLHVYYPFLRGELHFFDLFFPHNEHRIFFTKSLNLALLQLNGQWDVRLECVTNAILHSFFGALFFYIIIRGLKKSWYLLLYIACLCIFGMPIAWQNTLGGFHSQQYFLLLFSAATIYLLFTSKPYSPRWFFGFLTGILSNFTMAAGLFAAAAVIVSLTVGFLRQQRHFRDIWPTFLICGICVLIGFFMRVHVEGHEAAKAHTFHEFAFTILHILRWPSPGAYWQALIIQGPALILLARVLLIKNPTKFEIVLFTTIIWLALQYLATGYARGAGGNPPPSRYLDTIGFGLLINLTALLYLVGLPTVKNFYYHSLKCLLCVIWLGVFSYGLWMHLHTVISKELPEVGTFFRDCRTSVKGYIATNELKCLDNHSIPFPSAEGLVDRLNLNGLRSILPASVRRPIHLESDPNYSKNADKAFEPSTDALHPWILKNNENSNVSIKWASVPFSPTLSGFIMLQVFGDINKNATTVSFEDAATGRALPIQTLYLAENNCHDIFVRSNLKQLTLKFDLKPTGQPLAFNEPVEMGRLSFYAMMATVNPLTFGLLSAALLIFSGLLAYLYSTSTAKHIQPTHPSLSS